MTVCLRPLSHVILEPLATVSTKSLQTRWSINNSKLNKPELHSYLQCVTGAIDATEQRQSCIDSNNIDSYIERQAVIVQGQFEVHGIVRAFVVAVK